jgi:hypothetical protein
MFNKTYEERLASWREFRDSLEDDADPFRTVLDFYSNAPYVSRHTDPWTPEMWPNPWELINENQYDDFCRVLGMCYSLQLTERFKGSSFEIHISTNSDKSELHYLLYVDDTVINWNNNYVHKSELPQDFVSQETYSMDHVH